MNETSILRKLRPDELPALLELYRHLHEDDDWLPSPAGYEQVWESICANPLLHYFGAEVTGRLFATCTLTIIPNLTRAARPYGVVENVVTHPDFRKRGLATALLRHALDFARKENCYKVMLFTSRKDEATLRFYEQAGFQSGVKTGFVAKL
ncbi:GNAT family N-acetyltransferase [Roseimicrobium gellanilyticum]|uniref:GNAT family N-acetyltransferase n=1 Tax=Roseimicrobium gellanilyticum TaxID=748857 RepID=UPI001FE66AEF|nr:GNAT family N-acetyltransferase [Roseimicrobium gellanilyticum]